MLNTSRFNRYVSAVVDLRLRPHARVAVTLGAAIVVVLGALLAFDMPESLANGGLFEELFGSPHRQRVAEPLYYAAREHGWRISRRRHGRHYARHVRYARRHFPVGARQLAAAHPAPPRTVVLGRRSVCVRTCDGYFFPAAALNRNSEISSHQASCDTLCPEAETKLFVMPAGSENIDQAAAARGGELYGQLLAKIRASDAKPASCGCHSASDNPINSNAVLNDPTLRPGDTVVTANGVRVFKGGAYPFKSSDFMSLAETHDLPIKKRGALAAIDRVLQTPRGRFTLAGDHHREQQDRRRRQRSDHGLGFAPSN